MALANIFEASKIATYDVAKGLGVDYSKEVLDVWRIANFKARGDSRGQDYLGKFGIALNSAVSDGPAKITGGRVYKYVFRYPLPFKS